VLHLLRIVLSGAVVDDVHSDFDMMVVAKGVNLVSTMLTKIIANLVTNFTWIHAKTAGT
jgi:hypothetical protein